MGCGASIPDGRDERVAEPGEVAKPGEVHEKAVVGLHAPGRTLSIRRSLPDVPKGESGRSFDEKLKSTLGTESHGSGTYNYGGISRSASSGTTASYEANMPSDVPDPVSQKFADVILQHARFLVNHQALMEYNSLTSKHESITASVHMVSEVVQKPKLEARQFKSHTMDNVRVRRMCDELLHLEDDGHVVDREGKDKSHLAGKWMKTLQITAGRHVASIKMCNNPDVTIGGYFIISQMVSYIRGLITLDLSSNSLTAAEARVLCLGMKSNHCIQELALRENSIGSEGATSFAEMLKVNNSLMKLDLRTNNIRGNGICVLADSMSDNVCLTNLDVRWNYAGECSDYVESALVDLKTFCKRNLELALGSLKSIHESEEMHKEVDGLAHEANKPLNQGACGTTNATEEKKQSFRGEEEARALRDRDEIEPVMDNSSNAAKQHDRADAGKDLKAEASSALASAKDGLERLIHERRLWRRKLMTSMVSTETSVTKKVPCIGRMEVTILRADNLPQVIWSSGKDGEFLGLPQAYCVFSLNKQTSQTVIQKRNWAPMWNYTLNIGVREIWQVCSIKVMHSKTLSKTHADDFTIGCCTLPVGQVINWRGVSLGADGYWRAFHRPHGSGSGTIYTVCKGTDRAGMERDKFDTAEEAASAYDETCLKKDKELAVLNFAAAGDSRCVGQHVKEETFPLVGEDGVGVVGVQAGVPALCHIRLKYFMRGASYLELTLERAQDLPKMDAGLGSCDAYCKVSLGNYHFQSRVVRNSINPKFDQEFRISVADPNQALDLHVSIWDWDRFDDDDHMGDTRLTFTPGELVEGALDQGYAIIKPDAAHGPLKNGKGQPSLLYLRFSFISWKSSWE